MDLGTCSENWSRNKFGKMTTYQYMLTFPQFRQKSKVWAFGNDLGWIWLFQIFGYSGIWAKIEL